MPTTRPYRPKSTNPPALRRGQDIQRVRGYHIRREIVRLHVEEGKSLKETARILGRHYKRVHLLWAGIVKDATGERLPEAHKASVRAYCDQHLRGVIQDARRMVGDAAAYGAVVVAGVKALAELHGLKPEEVAPEGLSLEDVGRQVRVVSPLLIDKIDRVRALAGIAAERADGIIRPKVVADSDGYQPVPGE